VFLIRRYNNPRENGNPESHRKIKLAIGHPTIQIARIGINGNIQQIIMK
jgi:hypothetical protein